MEFVVRQFIRYEQVDHNATGHADGQPGDIEDGKEGASEQVTEYYLDKIRNHNRRVKRIPRLSSCHE